MVTMKSFKNNVPKIKCIGKMEITIIKTNE